MKRYFLTGIICFAAFWVLGMKLQDGYSLLLDSLYKKTVPLITVSEAEKLIQEEDAVILDTRKMEEFEVSHLKGAQQIDFESPQGDIIEGLPGDKPIFVYCSVGYRSERLGEILQAKGFNQVHNLYGGIFQWVNESKKVVDKYDRPTSRVHTFDRSWSIWLKRGIKVYD